MPYAIYPPIGFARIGNSPSPYFAAEAAGSNGLDIDSVGQEAETTAFKDDAYRVRPKAVRFHIFEIVDGAPPRPAAMPAGTVVRWHVSVANKKDAVVRPGSPPAFPKKVQDDPARADRAIAATGDVAGPDAAPVVLGGSYQTEPVRLGEIRTDVQQRLIFTGGVGRAQTLVDNPPTIGGNYYTNRNWFDDTCDGVVEATIEVPGAAAEAATAAWVVVGPPDFSPPSQGVVTLYDVIRQVAIDEGWSPAIARPWFETDIKPMIERVSGLRWVDDRADWGAISTDWAALADPVPAQATLRQDTANQVREVENVLTDFSLQGWQLAALDAYIAGDFEPGAEPDRGSVDQMTRAALDSTVGQGFYPGIEAGINMTDPTIYAMPFEFRLRTDTLRPGDVTAHMALPWQADFLKCAGGWWPAQRPNILPQQDGGTKPWVRPDMNHETLIEHVMQLGVATPLADGSVTERGRDPNFAE